ncbi:ras GTPase-activating protein 1 [Aethina tumida]|uniref:ras GTPase-activating protein 1 n=1 Tax=Aethina tumida TaxID=116153 RepID=UPI002148CD79|nr:ras GTPase-activating protein 1 [Aethina tumida]XP_049821607.1 ras GTPase-activating protein 1 [Aethina tumida]XP_049821608.1 ras GTPase-activating protein 1 [Aethina tumida]
MADLIRTGSQQGAGVMKDKLGSPSTGSEDGNEQDAQGPAKPEHEEQDLGDSAHYAPSETLWYHGRLDRYQAEERLWQCNKLGCYLVRESDRKPGSYVLSYLGRTGMNHFRITAVCGDFYIGGRQFVSLNDLVGYYTECSDLLKRERLVIPVAPPEPVNDKKRVVAILPYTKMPDTDELTFKKGDIFFVHNDMGNGWLWVTAHRTGEQGMIFRELVEDLDDSIDPNTVFPWFHPNCTKNEAVDLLVKAGPGSFLVRPSDNSPGDYSLFFHINNQIQRFRIEKKGVRYLMGGRIFECLDAVINRYRKEQIVEGYTLQHPLVVDGSKQLDWVPENQKAKCEAEKIYATLRECRDQAGLKKMRGIKHQGYLHRKSDKAAKKWKLLYFVLLVDGTDTHLYLYENPKRTKPKGLIDLSCAYLYQVHDSLWERSHCLQLVERALPCLATVTHLAARSTEECQEWVNSLKPLCVPQLSRATCKVPRLRELRCLTLHILDAHRLPFKLVPQPYVTIQLNNQVRIARTRTKSGPDPVWDEEFVFDDVPCDIVSFTLTVHNKGKRGKETEVAELHVELSTLGNGEEREEWYTLSGLTPMGEWGSLRLRTRYLHDLVMPAEEYSPLQQLLLEPGLASVKTLAEICHADRAPLATALLRVFRAEGRETELLRELNSAEIARETETSTLFRAASLATTLMDLYMRAECGGFLQAAVLETVLRLLESKQSAELNPAKMESLDDACSNAEFLLQILDQVTLSIFMSPDACPRSVRYICGCLQKAVVGKWPDERFVRTRVVSGFIFLRLLCPALLNPRQFGLVSEQPSPAATRSLVMVAKCLQNLANLVEFGGKEPYMEVVNPFILKNKERMVVFLDQLSMIGDPGEPRITSKPDTAKELATLHHICVAHLTQLQAVAKINPNIKTLVTVTDMLAKHKQKYLEMIR